MSSSLSGITADKGSGKSKATVISNGQVILLDIRGVTLWGGGGSVTFNLDPPKIGSPQNEFF